MRQGSQVRLEYYTEVQVAKLTSVSVQKRPVSAYSTLTLILSIFLVCASKSFPHPRRSSPPHHSLPTSRGL